MAYGPTQRSAYSADQTLPPMDWIGHLPYVAISKEYLTSRQILKRLELAFHQLHWLELSFKLVKLSWSYAKNTKVSFSVHRVDVCWAKRSDLAVFYCLTVTRNNRWTMTRKEYCGT